MARSCTCSAPSCATPADRAGSTVLAGHVDTKREGLGPLARLRTIEPGTEITVSADQGGTRRYRAAFGDAAYDVMLGECLWLVYLMLGKLTSRVHLLSRP